jgi:hypothetical protein
MKHCYDHDQAHFAPFDWVWDNDGFPLPFQYIIEEPLSSDDPYKQTPMFIFQQFLRYVLLLRLFEVAARRYGIANGKKVTPT